MRFKSTAKSGLLLWRGDSPVRANSDFLSMGLQDGALIFRLGLGLHTRLKVGRGEAPSRGRKMELLQMRLALKVGFIRELLCKHEILCNFCCFSYNLGSGSASIAVNGTFSDGKWHRVKAVR